jgi:hypothetical protein
VVSIKSHKSSTFSLLHSYSYNSESPYLVTPAKGNGAVGLDGWFVGWTARHGLVGCMIDEWHLRRMKGGPGKGRREGEKE